MAGLFHCTLILSLFTCTFIAYIRGQLVINVKNNGGDVERQSIEANTTADTVLLEFLSKDGTHVTQFIDFKSGSLPHTRFTDGVPDTWLYGSSSTGYIDHELFQTWFLKGFLPHCGRARPVVLIMDNHDAHISLPVIQAARANDVVLIGFPGHTTHILQPLDVKIIGPLKTNMASLASDLGIVCPSLTIGKSKYPVLLKYAMDRITPSTIIGAFVKAGIVPLDRGAIDESQLIPAMFPAVQNINDDNSAQTCKECGRFTVNPLVKAGLVPESLADILVPPASKPAAQRNKRRIVTEGRVISGDEILKELMDVQVFKVYVPWEEERGIVQPYPQVMCFVTRFGKNEFISSDAMSKLRQKNPTAIRSPEEDRGMETRELNLAVNLEKSGVLSPYLKSVCEDAADAIYAQDSDIKLLAQVLTKDLNAMMSATNASVTGNGTRCKDVSDIKKPCLCQLHICIGWYPCGLKYCRGKDSSGKVVNYRCGIKTCKRCLVFKYPVNQKMLCLWDDL